MLKKKIIILQRNYQRTPKPVLDKLNDVEKISLELSLPLDLAKLLYHQYKDKIKEFFNEGSSINTYRINTLKVDIDTLCSKLKSDGIEFENEDVIIQTKESLINTSYFKEGLIIAQPDLDYEFSKEYAHITVSGQSNNPQKLFEELKKEIEDLKQNGIDEKIFMRIKKKIYGSYVTEFDDVADIARMFMGDYFKGINSFDYIENHKQVTKQYTEEILKEVFDENKMILSIVRGK